MNIARKIYHRAFNLVMRILIPFFPYREPELIDELNGVINILNEKNIKKVMLITDKSIHNLGLTSPLEKIINDNGLTCVVYDKTLPNPTSENVEEARSLYLENKWYQIIRFWNSDFDNNIAGVYEVLKRACGV